MYDNQIPPMQPEGASVQPSMMYVHEALTWEYRRIDRPLDEEQLLSEDELNALGADGWELATSVTTGKMVCFYLRRANP